MADILEIVKEYKSALTQLYVQGFNKKNIGARPGGGDMKGSIRVCEAQMIYALIRKFKYKNILDIGTGNGFSALYMCRALQDEGLIGCVDTMDIADRRAEKGLDVLFDAFGLAEYINFYVGSSDFIIPKLDKLYDLVLIDGDHTYEQSKNDFKNSNRRMNPGGCFVFHDVYKKPEGQVGPRQFVEELILTRPTEFDVNFLNYLIFDEFKYDEDVADVNRIVSKWKSYNYSYVDPKTDPRELMAVVFKK